MTAHPPSDGGASDGVPAWAPPDAPLTQTPPAAGPPPVDARPPADAQPVPVRRRTNRFAIVALVTGLLGLIPVAAGFAVAAFVRTGRRGETGNGLAAGGLAASLAWAAAIAVVAAVGAPSLDASAPAARADGKVPVGGMRPGDCFSGFEETPAGVVALPLPCTTPHQGEVSADAELPDIPYPGAQQAADRAWAVCRERTGFLERSRYGRDLQLHVVPPDEDDWNDGNRAARCVLRYTGPGLLPAPLDQTMRTKNAAQLMPGDCVGTWNDDDGGDQVLVACTREHEYEVLAVYTPPGGDYPGDKAVAKEARDGCAERAARVWRSDPPSDIAEMAYATPRKDAWEAGNRTIFCLVTGRKGPLARSVVPH
ncbi:septum formation family protein [Actinomadura monticuli]|uniref:Septum formation family protein n=1 Tax=Actinomadura monticuli TaxID=3097367 RepID=A0ABV4Q9Y3_9ACTN